MYKIIGGDGKEYGPITADVLRQWVTEGRANAQSQVQPEGGAWIALGQLPEFAPLTGATQPDATSAAAMGAVGNEKALAYSVPAGWALTIVGLLGILMCIGLVVYYSINGMPANPFLEGLLSRQNASTSSATKIGQTVGLYGSIVLGIVGSAFVAFAGIKLRRLQSWGLVLTAAIIAIIPCCGSQFPMCLLSMPVGIWVIVVLCIHKRSFN